MEFVLDILKSDQQECDPNLVPVVSLGAVNSIKINATVFKLQGDQANRFLGVLNHKKFTIWTYSLHEDHTPSDPFANNWSLLLAFLGALFVFHAFGRSQNEKSYSTWATCILNVFRLSLSQPLRRDPKRWSMRFILISWVLFQMHAGVVYQGVLMSYEKSVDRHDIKYLVIPHRCLPRLQRLFETGHFKITIRRSITNTLRASSQTGFLMSVAGVGWAVSTIIFLVELWSSRGRNKDEFGLSKWQKTKRTRFKFVK